MNFGQSYNLCFVLSHVR